MQSNSHGTIAAGHTQNTISPSSPTSARAVGDTPQRPPVSVNVRPLPTRPKGSISVLALHLKIQLLVWCRLEHGNTCAHHMCPAAGSQTQADVKMTGCQLPPARTSQWSRSRFLSRLSLSMPKDWSTENQNPSATCAKECAPEVCMECCRHCRKWRWEETSKSGLWIKTAKQLS
jgi:hypothetical protein